MASENCPVCSAQQKELEVYDDDAMRSVLVDKPAQAGHLRVIPKKHFTILEQVPAELVAKLFILANKASTAIFESLNMQGTNILVNNGIAAGQKDPHFMIEVIPRIEGDGLKLEWQPTHPSEEEMATVELLLKQGLEQPVEQPKPVQHEKPIAVSVDNYLTMHLRRIP